MGKKSILERRVIHTSKNRRPYGAKLEFLLQDHYTFKFDGDCSLLIEKGLVLNVKPKNDNPHLKGGCVEVIIDGFATAGEAEKAGLKIALGLLWSAVSKSYSARLLYKTPLPCKVYDRTASVGDSCFGLATISMNLTLDTLVNPINEILSVPSDVDPKLLVALELFVSAKLETTARSKFVGLVSSLEPLATQEIYDIDELNELLSSFDQQLKDSNLERSLKNSLQGRARDLKRESVSRAIKRMVSEKLPNDTQSMTAIVEAYNIRSSILHEGATDADLELKSKEVEGIIKKLIEIHLKEYGVQGR